MPELTSNNDAIETITGAIQIYYDNYINQNGDRTKFVNQNISYANGNIYFSRTISNSNSDHYNDSYVMVYDADNGAYKYSMHFPSSHFWGHLEGVTIIGDKIFFGVNVHKGNPSSSAPNQSFLVYDGVTAIEEQYRADHNINPKDDDEDGSSQAPDEDTGNEKPNYNDEENTRPDDSIDAKPDIHVPNTGQTKITDEVITVINLGITPLAIILIIHIIRKRKNSTENSINYNIVPRIAHIVNQATISALVLALLPRPRSYPPLTPSSPTPQ